MLLYLPLCPDTMDRINRLQLCDFFTTVQSYIVFRSVFYGIPLNKTHF
jgi:hypothetical protein